MTDAPDVTELNAQLEETRTNFRLSQDALRSALGVAKAAHGADEILLSHANEFGVAETLRLATADPASFDFDAAPSPGSLAALKPALEKALGHLKRMEAIVSMRENIFQKIDPKHSRVYTWLGREFIVLPEQRALKYLDTGKVEAYGLDREAERKAKAGKESGREL